MSREMTVMSVGTDDVERMPTMSRDLSTRDLCKVLNQVHESELSSDCYRAKSRFVDGVVPFIGDVCRCQHVCVLASDAC